MRVSSSFFVTGGNARQGADAGFCVVDLGTRDIARRQSKNSGNAPNRQGDKATAELNDRFHKYCACYGFKDNLAREQD